MTNIKRLFYLLFVCAVFSYVFIIVLEMRSVRVATPNDIDVLPRRTKASLDLHPEIGVITNRMSQQQKSRERQHPPEDVSRHPNSSAPDPEIIPAPEIMGLPAPEIMGQSAQHVEQGADHCDLMINGYMRSGSTFVGSLFGFRGDSFYWYEPLLKTHEWLFHKGRNLTCEYLHPICHTEHETLGRSYNTTLTFLRDIYHCRLARNTDMISTTTLPYTGVSWSTFKSCNNKGNSVETCVLLAEQACNAAKIRVTKVLRMSVESLEPLLDLVPRLKIIHLLRDPRAIINSHLHTKWFPIGNTNDTILKDDIEALCKRMHHDVITGKELMKKYPDRFGFIHYEDITTSSDHIQHLMSMVNIRLSLRDLIQVKGRIHGPSRSYLYRKSLPFEVVKIIDNHCGEVYRELGLKQFNSLAEYQDLQQPPIIDRLPFSVFNLFASSVT